MEPSGRRVSFAVDADGALRSDLDDAALRRAIGAPDARLWLDIDSRNDADWRLLSEVFHFHPLAIEDTRSPNCRIKLEEYEGYLFVVAREIRFAMETPEPYDIDTRNLYLFLGANFMVTVHAEPSHATTIVADRLEAGPDPLARGVDHLAYVVLDTLVDQYFPCLDQIDDFVDELEAELFGNGEVLEKTFELKRALLALRRNLAPMREVMASLANRPSAYLGVETQIYFRDVYDHVVRQVESIETYRELLTGATETYLTLVSNRMNGIIKALSVIATVVLPPTLVASIYGMNFDWLPGRHSPYGFWMAFAIMVGLTGGLLAYVWRKGWL
ncbi:MAG TPA: magnesium/cobalt transporter CorA [Longimicrobiales bacterium]